MHSVQGALSLIDQILYDQISIGILLAEKKFSMVRLTSICHTALCLKARRMDEIVDLTTR